MIWYYFYFVDAANIELLWHAGWKSRDSVPKLVQEYMSGKLKVDEFVSHTMDLDHINEAFDLMHSGQRSVGMNCTMGELNHDMARWYQIIL